MAMLTPEDLKAIGQIVDERLDAKLDEKLDAKLDEKLDAKIPGLMKAAIESTVPAMIKAGIESTVPVMLKIGLEELETRMDVKFDAVQERLDSIENRMLTRPDLEHALLNFETRLTERYDHRYVRRV